MFNSAQQIVVKRGNSGENVNKVLSGTLSFASVVCANKRGVANIRQTGQHTWCLFSDKGVCVCVGVMTELFLSFQFQANCITESSK